MNVAFPQIVTPVRQQPENAMNRRIYWEIRQHTLPRELGSVFRPGQDVSFEIHVSLLDCIEERRLPPRGLVIA